jgi:hypothetical protein
MRPLPNPRPLHPWRLLIVVIVVITASGGLLTSCSCAPPPAEEAPLTPTGDAELDALRHLAVRAPLDELIEQSFSFLVERARVYHEDEVLWRGVARIARAIPEQPERFDRNVVLLVGAMIRDGNPPAELGLHELLPALARHPSRFADVTLSGTLPSTGDADLDNLRQMAARAPLEDLLDVALGFMVTRERTYPEDRILWFGFDRIARACAAEHPLCGRSVLVAVIATIEGGRYPAERRLEELLPRLRELRDAGR